MISAMLHLIHLLFSFLAGTGLYLSYAKNRCDKLMRDFSAFFLLFAVFEIFLSSFVFMKDLFLLAWIYNISMIPFFMMLLFALRVPIFILKTPSKARRAIESALIATGILVIIIQIYNFRLPVIDSSGFIFWNANPVALWLASISGFVTAMTWFFVFLKNFQKNLDLKGKFKNIMVIISAFMFAISALTYFRSHSVFSIIAFITMFIGVLSILVIILIPNKNNLKIKS